MQVEVKEKQARDSGPILLSRILIIVGAVVLFLLAIDLISYSFLHIRQQLGTTILSVADNPFIGLFIGLLLTAVIQSSSTSTTMIVALVGSGAMSLSAAVPIVMGANVGTTLTSTLVSLSFIAKKREFRKAISAATVHDFYNVILVAIMFPLEYNYQLLSRLSAGLVVWLNDHLKLDLLEAVPFGRGLLEGVGHWVASLIGNDWLLLLLSFALLFTTIKLISQFMSRSLIGSSRERLKEHIFQNPYKAFAWGGILTAAVQSSSITTSLIVPLVAKGKVSLHKAFPFVMGANVGTTITALVATLFSSQAALELAIVHFLFNLFGALLFLPYQPIRRWPELLAATFGKLTLRHRIYGFLYILLLFFAIPFLLIYCYRQGLL
ncbi:MAG: Na/Pi symporter [Tunicatimonas sp.]